MENTFIALRESIPYYSNMLNRPLGLQKHTVALFWPGYASWLFFWGKCRMFVKGARLLLDFFQNICALQGIACCKSATHGVNTIAGPFHLQTVDCSLLCMTLLGEIAWGSLG